MSFPSAVETSMLMIINDERCANGLAPLTFGGEVEPPQDETHDVQNIFAPLGSAENMTGTKAPEIEGTSFNFDLLAEVVSGEEQVAQSGFWNFTKPFNFSATGYRVQSEQINAPKERLSAASA